MTVKAETGDFFNLMRMAYKTGVLEKLSDIQCDAMESPEGEARWDSGVLVELLDGADPSGAERWLQRSRIPVRLLASGCVMSAISRLLDLAVVRRGVTKSMRKKMERVLSGQPC